MSPLQTESSPSVLHPALAQDLQAILGAEGFITAPDRLLVYESDGLTQYRVAPLAVALPRSAEEFQAAIEALHRHDQTFVVRGAGTGLSGGALPLRGGIVVGTARLNRILEVSPEDRRARVEPGVINAHLTRRTLSSGLLYAPDPSSQSACTLGGNVAENSGGPHCLKYGVTSRYITGLTVILPDGSIARLGGMGREEQGLDLVGLFVGSEGCFGAASEIEVALTPQPESVRTLLALFQEVETAGVAVTSIMAHGLLPAALEIVDRETILAVEASVFAAGYPTHVGAALVVEFDGMEAGLDAEIEQAARLCLEAGAEEVRRAHSEQERMGLWQGRKKAFGAMGRVAPDLLVQDATVPRSRLPEVLRAIEEIGRRYDLRIANVFHAGDGNLHPNLLFDRRDPDQLARVEAASAEIMETCISAGGTITGEHGVGVDKRRYMPRVYSPQVLTRMGEVKAVFDPAGRCNPGKVLPDGYGPPLSNPRGAARPGWTSSLTSRLEGLQGRLCQEFPAEAFPKGSEFPPASVLPSSSEEVAVVLRLAAEQGVPIRPFGLGREFPLQSSLPPQALFLGTQRLTSELDAVPEDLQVRADAGVTLARLSQALESQGQWLPVDAPGALDITLGGMVATGVTGPLGVGYGRIRDQLLGLSLVDGSGSLLALGGRVVKNVAGFDLVRLTAGSRGALGVITSITLRVFPIPEADLTLVWSGIQPAQLSGLRSAFLSTGLPWSALEVIADPGQSGLQLLARVHGSHAAAAVARARSLAIAGQPALELEGATSRQYALEQAQREATGSFLVRIGGRPGSGLARLEALLPLTGSHGSGVLPEGTRPGRPGPSIPTVSLALGLLDGRLRTLSPPADGAGLRVPLDVVASGLRRVISSSDLFPSVRLVRVPDGLEGFFQRDVSVPLDPEGVRSRRLEEDVMDHFDPEGILPGKWDPDGWRGVLPPSPDGFGGPR